MLQQSKLRILLVTTEFDPFLCLTPAATWIRELAEKLHEKGHESRILMPKFGVIEDRRYRLHEVKRLSGISIRVGSMDYSLNIKVGGIPGTRLQVYFLDNPQFWGRKGIFHDPQTKEFYPDNDERIVFFAKGVIQTVRKLGWTPQIIHLHGWINSLLLIYLRTQFHKDPHFEQGKVLFTLSGKQQLNFPLPASFAEKARYDQSSEEFRAYVQVPTYQALTETSLRLADTYEEIQLSPTEDPLDTWLSYYALQ